MTGMPDVLAPALAAAGFARTKESDGDNFERGGDAVELFRNGDHWWIVIIVNHQLTSESRINNISQALRILWAYGLIEWNWASGESVSTHGNHHAQLQTFQIGG